MRIILSTFIFTLFSLNIFSNTKIWTGTGGNKLWSNANNWSPSGYPSTTDDVIFNSSDSVNVDGPFVSGDLYINSLKISNNSNVLLSYLYNSVTGTTRNIYLSSTSTSPYGLEIETGATLTFSCSFIYSAPFPGISQLNFNLSPTAGAGLAVPCLINGELIFTGYVTNTSSGNGGCNARFDTYSGATSLSNCIVYGKIKYYPNTGNTTATASSLTIKNGASFEILKPGGSFPTANYEQNSYCRFISPIATSGPSFLGSVYGNLEWNTPGLTSAFGFNNNLTFNKVNIINTSSKSLRVKSGPSLVNYDFIVNDSLIIGSAATIETSGSTTIAPYGGKIILKGNLLNNGTLTKTGPIGTRDTIEFAGTSNQVIKNLGTISNQLCFKINNPTNIFLESPLQLPYHLLLKNGKVNTTNTNLLTLSSVSNIYSNNSTLYTNLPTATYNNYGSDNSYIVGPIKKLGLSATSKFGFPVGSTTFHRPIFLNNVTGDFTVEYKNVSPRTISTTYDPALNHISNMEYWEITGTNSPTANVELTFYDPNSGGVTNMADLQIAHYNGTQWDMIGNNNPISGTLGTAGSNGAITSNVLTSFSPFALASTSTANPLPVYYTHLKVIKNKTNNYLHWQSINDVDVKNYELQKSNNGIDFLTINTTYALQINNTSNYNYLDNSINSKAFYRIKTNLKSNVSMYTNIVLVNRNLQKNILIYPNPAKNNIILISDINNGKLLIYDVLGKLIKTEIFNNQNIELNTSNLRKGKYLVKIEANTGFMQYSNFIKE